MVLGLLLNTCVNTGLHCVTEIMKDTPSYTVVPLHKHPEKTTECCQLLNSEWPRSKVARLRSLNVSCERFPTCLILLDGRNSVVGHCKISVIPNLSRSCFIESVVISKRCRSRGLGTILMQGAEEYVTQRGIRNLYLTTKGQEQFYAKIGYSICDAFNVYENSNTFSMCPFEEIPDAKETARNTKVSMSGPPPPPMPSLSVKCNLPWQSAKTYMVKKWND